MVTHLIRCDMIPEPAIANFQATILAAASAQLGRSLTLVERSFVMSRKGFLALEAIQDMVATRTGADLERYLRSESEDVSKPQI